MPSILPTFPLNSKVQNKSRFKHVVDLRWRDGVDILFAGHFAPESSHRQTTIDDDFLLLFRGSQIILHRDSNRIWDRRCISDGFWWKYTIYRREKGSELCVCECVCVCDDRRWFFFVHSWQSFFVLEICFLHMVVCWFCLCLQVCATVVRFYARPIYVLIFIFCFVNCC